VTEPAHAILSASGFKKWSTCTMSAAMEMGLEDEDSDFSREGTCAHAVSEVRISNALALGPQKDESLVPGYSEFYSKEFSECVDEFVEYVLARVEECQKEHGRDNVHVLLEQRLDFSQWVPAGFGTGDVVVLMPGKCLVIDLKFGKGVFVEGAGNGQLRLYALGAYARYHTLYEFTPIESVIHQPRKSNVSGETIELEGHRGLLEWAEQVVRPRAAIAWAAVHGDRELARFSPGAHCSEAFCKARYVCGARARYMLELAEIPWSLTDPDVLTIDQLERIVDKADLAVKWAADVKSYLIKSAARGSVELQRYELVEGRSVRVISDPQAAAAVLVQNGFSNEDLYKEPELLGLTQLEKLVGAKKLTELLGNLLQKPSGKPTLAPRGSGKTSVLPRSEGTAQDAFGNLD